MRVCATYGSPVPLRAGSEMHEIRLDVFGSVPEIPGKDSVITLCGRDVSAVPESFGGLVDAGENGSAPGFRMIRSFHDFGRTPDADTIVSMLSEGDQEISKGAFLSSSFRDLASIMDASKRIGRKHVLLGMGETGKITRIRQKKLGNEFTFGYCGTPTAPGQLSAGELESLGDDCVILGIAGHPLSHTKSPQMQEAAMRNEGITGKYLVFDSPDPDRIEDVIRDYDIRGMNVTIPFKQEILKHLDRLSPEAEKTGAVNTIVNSGGVLRGHNTDIAGVAGALEGIPLKGSRVLVMGAGGAARAAVFSLEESGCRVFVSGRRSGPVSEICRDLGSEPHSGSVSGFDIVINCTPVGLTAGEYPADISDLDGSQIAFDMVYGRRTPFLDAAEKKGCRTADGSDMLVAQGAESFRLWFGKRPDAGVMREALRWREDTGNPAEPCRC